eukprot:TRINITY_DN4614_c0_g2_i1.p1 TRINITY_DN4614_c0_g2~~TRINITY_DN4614_c0_g2_i1.p1  ORF type:complete len:227 (-),score=33.29 TRINITY_DN4614_c0_g2_i1:173-853(-)
MFSVANLTATRVPISYHYKTRGEFLTCFSKSRIVPLDRCLFFYLFFGFFFLYIGTRSFAASSMCNATCFLDQHQIVTGHQDGILRVYDAGTGAEMTELRQSLGYSITGLSQTSVGRPVIAACCRSNVIQCLDTITMSPVDTLSTSDFRVASHWCKARFSSDGAHLIAPSGSGKIEVWKRDDKTFKHETSLECGSSAIMACDWHNLGLQVVGGDKMGSTHIFGHCGV